MPPKQKLWIAGIVMAPLLIAWVLSPAVGRPLAFIGAFSVAGLWLLGPWRTPRLVQKARRDAESRPPRMPNPHPQVPERQFRMRIHWAGLAVIYLFGLVTLAGGLALIVGAAMNPGAWRDLLAGGLLVVGYGVSMTYYVWRYNRLTFRIDPHGLDADCCLAT